ncbi:hypothetical protein [Bacillus paralicheniformis]|uniref:hypothetical protein n=1 Tax=Bacillus paralicheniformis TaxID=1648923 RepID=UPI001D0550E7|nr:hypothetical protein [Bacillus paralicheniformis]
MYHALKEPDGKRLLHYARLAAEDYADESDMVDLADLSSSRSEPKKKRKRS